MLTPMEPGSIIFKNEAMKFKLYIDQTMMVNVLKMKCELIYKNLVIYSLFILELALI